MYKKVTSDELFAAISSGYTPVWFSVENSTLTVDLCVNYRLDEGKTLFLKHYNSNQDELAKVARQVAALSRDAWSKAIENMTVRLEEELQNSASAEALISTIVGEEGEAYRFTYESGHIKDYICVTSCGPDVFMKKLNKDSLVERYSDKLVHVRELVSKNTVVSKVLDGRN